MTSTSKQVHSWCAETSPRGVLYHALRLPRLFMVLRENRALTRLFVVDTLQNRFQGNVLGSLWVLIHPLFLFAVYFVIFGLFFGRWEDEDPVQFALYLFSGLVCFQCIVAGTVAGMGSISGSGANLIKKVAFPSEILPMVPVLTEVAVFLVGLGLALVIGIATGRADLGWQLLLLPWFLVALLAFAIGLSLTLATLSVFLPDVRNIYGIFTTAWFFLSPNFWWPSYLGGREPWVLDVLGINPVYHLLIAERQVLGLAPAEDTGIVTPVTDNLLMATLWGGVFLVVGYASFMSNRDKFPDLVT